MSHDTQDAAVSTNIFTMAQLNEAIEAMAKAQLGAANSIAKVIVMVAFAANHGFVNADTGVATPTAEPANSLFKNLRKGVKKDAIVALLEERCNLAYVSGTWSGFAAGKDWEVESIKAIKVAAAAWETYKKASVPDKALDVIDEFEALVARLVKRSSKKDTLGHAEQLVKLQSLLGEIKGEVLFEA